MILLAYLMICLLYGLKFSLGFALLKLLPTNANLGRIMGIMETNISLLELLFVLNNQIIDINI